MTTEKLRWSGNLHPVKKCSPGHCDTHFMRYMLVTETQKMQWPGNMHTREVGSIYTVLGTKRNALSKSFHTQVLTSNVLAPNKDVQELVDELVRHNLSEPAQRHKAKKEKDRHSAMFVLLFSFLASCRFAGSLRVYPTKVTSISKITAFFFRDNAVWRHVAYFTVSDVI